MASKDSEGREQSTAERLVDVAGEIFVLKGRSATVREICSAAECSVAAINYYFGDKNQLYLQCVRTACEHKQKLFPLPTHIEQQDPEQVMRSFLRASGDTSAGYCVMKVGARSFDSHVSSKISVCNLPAP